MVFYFYSLWSSFVCSAVIEKHYSSRSSQQSLNGKRWLVHRTVCYLFSYYQKKICFKPMKTISHGGYLCSSHMMINNRNSYIHFLKCELLMDQLHPNPKQETGQDLPHCNESQNLTAAFSWSKLSTSVKPGFLPLFTVD